MNGIRNTAQAMPKASCYNCHVEHAKRDNVFLQFYRMLEDVDPRPMAAHDAPASHGMPAAAPAPPVAQAPTAPALAIGGLDPVLLVTGQEEKGKPEIVAVHKGYRYQFVSEPHRASFAADPQKYAIQNDTCPVVPGAPVDPSLFVVYNGKIYGMATPDCITQFKSRPTDYVKP
jgi:YHS domain-containing protein